MISEAGQKWHEAARDLKLALNTDDEARIKECREKLSAVEQEEILDAMEAYSECTLRQLAAEMDSRGIVWNYEEKREDWCRRLAEHDTGLQSAVVVASE